MVAGVSARLKFDERYRDFFALVRSQIGAAIANARTFDEEKRRATASPSLQEIGELHREPAGPSQVRRPRIVLAEDNADMRDYVRRILGQNYDVINVGDGRAALKTASEHTPDLVLTDVMMPGLDGFGLLRELRKNDKLKLVPVIMMFARAGEESRIEGLRSGADDYLIKPFSARELLARVRDAAEASAFATGG
jgi:CheY-like chemotaxis protein